MRKWLRVFAKTVAVIVLGIVTLVLFVLSAISHDFPGTLVCLFLACISSYAIQSVVGITRQPINEDEWKVTIWACAFLLLLSIIGTYDAVRDAARPIKDPPPIEQLNRSTGVLKKGIGYRRYLSRDHQPDLILFCAGESVGRHTSHGVSCLQDADRSYIGKQVTIRHLPPYKAVRWSVRFFEMRAGNKVIVPYERTAGLVRWREEQRHAGYYRMGMIFLGVMGIYMIVVAAIRRRRTPAA